MNSRCSTFFRNWKYSAKTFDQYCLERIPFKKLRYTLIDKHESFKMGLSEQEIISSKIKRSLFYQNTLKEFLDNIKGEFLYYWSY